MAMCVLIPMVIQVKHVLYQLNWFRITASAMVRGTVGYDYNK